jgi:hypothetical protein
LKPGANQTLRSILSATAADLVLSVEVTIWELYLIAALAKGKEYGTEATGRADRGLVGTLKYEMENG